MTKLLIVDDRQQNLYMLQVLLSSSGFEVELASNGAEALEQARRAPPDIIISDILMPAMDGFALCRSWKEDEQLKDIPFVFYTATYTDPKDKDFALSLGAERFIVKPVEPDELLALLRETIETHNKADKLVAPREPMEKAQYYKEYNAALVRKLEDKVLQLEEMNRALELDIAERRRAEEALKQRAAQLALINKVGRQVAAVLDLQSVFDQAAHLVQEIFGCHYVAVFTLDRERGELVMQARASSFAHLFPSEHRIRLGDGMVGRVGSYGETLLANDVDTEPRYVNFYPDVPPTRAELSVPIRVGEEIVGALDVQSDQLNAFDENDVLAIETLADQIAVAIENARLYQELRQHAEELEQRVQERTAQLQAQYARLEAILSSVSDGIVVTDNQGQILLTNPVAQAWLTRTLLAEDIERLQSTVCDLTTRAAERPETVLELAGLDLQLSAAPISETSADGATAVVAVHDVSQLKALDRLKSRFVSNVTHELRTPITTIKLYATLLRRSKPEKWPGYLDALTQAADRQAKLVEDLLQVSCIDAGRMEFRPQPANLNELAETVVTSHQILAQNKDLVLEHRPATPSPTSLVDTERLMQVLNNLVENAIHHTPQGKVEITAGQAEMESRTWATIRVTDTGTGIPQGELPHIFERFYRGEKSRQTGLPGTGLGLAIAKEIVELHDGRITVESQVKVGSTFTVWLPLVEE